MSITIRFVISGLLTGILITISMYIYKHIDDEGTMYDHSESGPALDIPLFADLNTRGFEGNVIFSVLYHLREEDLDRAKHSILSIDDEEHRFTIVEKVAAHILDKASRTEFYRSPPQISKNRKEEKHFDVTLAKEFGPSLLEILLEIEPKQASNQYMDALQIVIKLLKESGNDDLSRKGIDVLDRHIVELSPIYNKQRALDEKVKLASEERSMIDDSYHELIIGSIITGTLTSIGFVLSLLLAPLFRSYGERLADKDTV